MLALQLYVDGDDLGALNLYLRRPAAFTDESEHVGLLSAAHAAVAYAAARGKERMSRGLLTQQVIGQAQGILMERHRLTGDRAFALLVATSQRSTMKLRDVAARLARSGELRAVPARSRPERWTRRGRSRHETAETADTDRWSLLVFASSPWPSRSEGDSR